MEITRLSWRQLEAAKEKQSAAMLGNLKAMGGDLVKALKEVGEKEKQNTAAAAYDRGAVLNSGIVKWSYDEEVNSANIDALDEQTASWAAAEILSLNEPRSEDDQKNA